VKPEETKEEEDVQENIRVKLAAANLKELSDMIAIVEKQFGQRN